MRALSLLLCVSVFAPAFTRAAGEDKPSPIGKKVADFTLRDYRGAERSLGEFAKNKLLVLAFVGSECPLAKLYGPRLAALAKEFESKGVAFIGVNANQQDSISAIARYAKESGISFPILKDVGNVVADKLGALRTPEVFVLDQERVVRYWGRIDDQYGIGFARPKIGRRDLASALEELLAGKNVTTSLTQAPGCFIGRVQPEAKSGSVTYARQIAPILQRRCVECHQAGEIGPFSLTTYDEVAGWTETIREVVRDRRMPPWFADARYGQFTNDCHLPDDERRLILQWIDEGAPRGDDRSLPAAMPTHGWRIPKPDLVVTMPRPFKVPAQGTVPYQYFIVDPGFSEDKWVKAAEIRPSCRAVVHHVLAFVQPPNSAGIGNRDRGFISNWLAVTVPGGTPLLLPEGAAKRIPAGSRLMFQVHYTPNGAPQTDQTSIALVFADPKTVRQEVVNDMAINTKFRIPPNDGNYRIESTKVLNRDSLLVSLFPHTHLRGKAFQFEAVYPSGDKEILLDIPHYDFNWQTTYVLAQPKRLPKGTKIHCVAYYDNSKNNFSNPNPNAAVQWGEQTWEEMMIGYFDAVAADEDLIKKPRAAVKQPKLDRPPLDPELRRLAGHALDSQKDFEAFAAAAHKALPKMDRICLTTFGDDKLRVERSAYPGEVTQKMAEAGFVSDNGRFMILSGYALMNQFAVNSDLQKSRAPDLKMMSKALASSVHVPVAFEGRPGTVNFWSKEKSAFPSSTHPLVRALVEAMMGRK
jgi:peroxiredoxin